MIELVWAGFIALFLGLLFLDLSVLHRESATLSVKQALFWTGVWISVAMSFTFVVYGLYEHRWFGFVPGQGVGLEGNYGSDAVLQYITGSGLEGARRHEQRPAVLHDRREQVGPGVDGE